MGDTENAQPQKKIPKTHRTSNNSPIPLPNLQPPISIGIILRDYRLRFRVDADAGTARDRSDSPMLRRAVGRWIEPAFAVEEFMFEELEGGGGEEETETAANVAKSFSSNVSVTTLCDGMGVRRDK